MFYIVVHHFTLIDQHWMQQVSEWWSSAHHHLSLIFFFFSSSIALFFFVQRENVLFFAFLRFSTIHKLNHGFFCHEANQSFTITNLHLLIANNSLKLSHKFSGISIHLIFHYGWQQQCRHNQRNPPKFLSHILTSSFLFPIFCTFLQIFHRVVLEKLFLKPQLTNDYLFPIAIFNCRIIFCKNIKVKM